MQIEAKKHLSNKSKQYYSSIVCEVIGTVFFYKTYFKPKTHKTITSN